jgi:acid phosphatase
MEENHGYSSVIGSAAMPYLNSLASSYGLATQYYANAHPSIPNYLMLTSGQFLTTNDGTTSVFSDDNLVRRMVTGGKTWKSYAESLPSVGYLGADVYPYARRHNPMVFYSDVVNSTAQQQNLVPFNQFATDLASGQLPNFSYIVPNLQDDAHDCPPGMSTCTDGNKLSHADQWLQTNLSSLLSSSSFQAGGDGLLLILWDESGQSDKTHGGGQTAAVLIGPNVIPGVQPSTFYQHESVLKLILESLGLPTDLGAATLAPEMVGFFSSTPPVLPPVSVSPTSQFFGKMGVGATSAPQSVTVTNNQSVSLQISGVTGGGDFFPVSNCPPSLAPTANCTISTTFTPSVASTSLATLTISDDAPGSPQVIYLGGAGVNVGPNPDPPPAITSMSPSSGPDTGGSSVAITGTGFANGATVSFADTPSLSVNVISASSLSAIAPGHSDGPVAVTVSNPDGQSAVSTNQLPNPGFELGIANWKFSSSGNGSIQNQPGNARTGINYAVLSSQSGNHPYLNAVDAKGNLIYFSVTPGQVLTFSDWASRMNGDGYGRLGLAVYDSNKANATYVLTSPNNVTTSSWTLQQNTYTVPAGKAYARIYAELNKNTMPAVVRFDDIYFSIGNVGTFSYVPPNPAPTVASMSPNTGPIAGGTTVTITGTGFLSGAGVSFAGFAASRVNVTGATSLTAITPPSTAAGPVNITVTNPDGQSATFKTNQLVNPGFESGNANWRFIGAGSGTVQNNAANAHSGNGYAELSSGAGSHPMYDAADNNGNILYFSVTPGEVIAFGGWCYRISGDGVTRPALALYDSSKANPSYVVAAPNNVTAAAWTFQQMSYTVPAGKAYARFYIEIYKNTASADARFDDMALALGTGFTYTSK